MIAEEVYRKTEAQRAECEAREIARMEEKRREFYLDSVGRKRGRAVERALRARVWKLLHP